MQFGMRRALLTAAAIAIIARSRQRSRIPPPTSTSSAAPATPSKSTSAQSPASPPAQPSPRSTPPASPTTPSSPATLLTAQPFTTSGRLWVFANPARDTAAEGDTNTAARGFQGTLSGSVLVNGVNKTFSVTVATRLHRQRRWRRRPQLRRIRRLINKPLLSPSSNSAFDTWLRFRRQRRSRCRRPISVPTPIPPSAPFKAVYHRRLQHRPKRCRWDRRPQRHGLAQLSKRPDVGRTRRPRSTGAWHLVHQHDDRRLRYSAWRRLRR